MRFPGNGRTAGQAYRRRKAAFSRLLKGDLLRIPCRLAPAGGSLKSGKLPQSFPLAAFGMLRYTICLFPRRVKPKIKKIFLRAAPKLLCGLHKV